MKVWRIQWIPSTPFQLRGEIGTILKVKKKDALIIRIIVIFSLFVLGILGNAASAIFVPHRGNDIIILVSNFYLTRSSFEIYITAFLSSFEFQIRKHWSSMHFSWPHKLVISKQIIQCHMSFWSRVPYTRHYNPRFIYFYPIFEGQKRFLMSFFL